MVRSPFKNEIKKSWFKGCEDNSKLCGLTVIGLASRAAKQNCTVRLIFYNIFNLPLNTELIFKVGLVDRNAVLLVLIISLASLSDPLSMQDCKTLLITTSIDADLGCS